MTPLSRRELLEAVLAGAGAAAVAPGLPLLAAGDGGLDDRAARAALRELAATAPTHLVERWAVLQPMTRGVHAWSWSTSGAEAVGRAVELAVEVGRDAAAERHVDEADATAEAVRGARLVRLAVPAELAAALDAEPPQVVGPRPWLPELAAGDPEEQAALGVFGDVLEGASGPLAVRWRVALADEPSWISAGATSAEALAAAARLVARTARWMEADDAREGGAVTPAPAHAADVGRRVVLSREVCLLAFAAQRDALAERETSTPIELPDVLPERVATLPAPAPAEDASTSAELDAVAAVLRVLAFARPGPRTLAQLLDVLEGELDELAGGRALAERARASVARVMVA